MSAERWIFAAFIAWLGVRACVAQPVAAQDESLVADVVRLTWHEANGNLADADGIYAALVNGAERRGMTPHAFARIHSRRFFGGQTTRRWALELRLDCERPPSFRGRWDTPRASGARSGALSRHDACVALVEHVRAIVQAPPRCPATTWGSRVDHERARLRGQRLRIVECAPGARNLFSLPAGAR